MLLEGFSPRTFVLGDRSNCTQMNCHVVLVPDCTVSEERSQDGDRAAITESAGGSLFG